MNNNEVLEDFRRRWNHTFVWLKMKSKSIESLAYIRDVEYDENKIGVIHLDSAEYGSITINLGSADHQLNFRFPQVGVFQHKTQAVLFRRIAARQWRRGICGDNSFLRNTTAPLVGNQVSFDLATLASAFEHRTIPLPQALEGLSEHRARSVALRDNVSLSLSLDSSSDYLVLYWDNVVGRCDEKGKLTKLFEPTMESLLRKTLEN